MDVLSGALGALQLINTVTHEDDSQKQQNYTLELMQKQSEYNKEAMQLQKEAQLDIFNRTGYEARVEQLKKAGLNPAMIYGMGAGGGGGVTGNISAPQVSQGAAPNVAIATANKTAQIGMALQLSKLESEIEVNKSIAEANRASVPQKGASAELEGQQAKTEILKRFGISLDNSLKEITITTTQGIQEATIKKAQEEAKAAEQLAIKLSGEAEQAVNLGKISTETYKIEVNQRIENLKETMSKVLVNTSQNTLNNQEAINVVNKIILGYDQLAKDYKGQAVDYARTALETETQLDKTQIEATAHIIGSLLGGISTLAGASIIKGAKPTKK